MTPITQQTRASLLSPILAVSGIVEKSQVFPILSHILLERQGNRLSFLSSDLEIQIQTWIDLGEENPGEDAKITFPAKKCIDILRAFSDQTLLAFKQDDNVLRIESDHAQFILQTLPAADFPTLFDIGEPLGTLTVDQKTLKQLLTKAQFAMAHQDVRYYFNGMLFSTDKDRLRVVATDGHRLAVAESEPLKDGLPEISVILPRKTVLELLKQLVSDETQSVEVRLFQGHIVFSFDHLELRSKLIDGKFPDYQMVVPKDYVAHFDVMASQFKEVLQRAAILADDKLRGVRVVVEGDQLTVTAVNSDQEQAEETLAIIATGQPLDIGLNVNYLLDVLSNIDSTELNCAYRDAKSSVLITYHDDPLYKHIIMPMRI